MNDSSFSIADAEALFGPEAIERIKREVAAAPRFTPEQCEKFRALFATAGGCDPSQGDAVPGGRRAW